MFRREASVCENTSNILVRTKCWDAGGIFWVVWYIDKKKKKLYSGSFVHLESSNFLQQSPFLVLCPARAVLPARSKLCPEHCVAQVKANVELWCPALPLNSRWHIQTRESQKPALLCPAWAALPACQCAPGLTVGTRSGRTQALYRRDTISSNTGRLP